MPVEHGGSGLGITEAAIMMQAIAESGAAMSGASAVHMNIFGLQPVVVFGTEEQKQRMLPPMIAGRDKACFAVTEPDAGLDTTNLKLRAEAAAIITPFRRKSGFLCAGGEQGAIPRSHHAARAGRATEV
jgi:alkylation response protein AidB-like acyl-CoA dehydrogenase